MNNFIGLWPGRLPSSRSGTKLWSSILLAVMRQSLRASAGEMGGMSGKKFGFGRFRARPVIRQNDMFNEFHFFPVSLFQKFILKLAIFFVSLSNSFVLYLFCFWSRLEIIFFSFQFALHSEEVGQNNRWCAEARSQTVNFPAFSADLCQLFFSTSNGNKY